MPDNTCLAFINVDGKFECVSDATIEDNYLCGFTDHFSEFGFGNFKTTSSNIQKDSSDGTPFWAWIILAAGVAFVVTIAVVIVLVFTRKKAEVPDGIEMSAKNPYFVDS